MVAIISGSWRAFDDAAFVRSDGRVVGSGFSIAMAAPNGGLTWFGAYAEPDECRSACESAGGCHGFLTCRDSCRDDVCEKEHTCWFRGGADETTAMLLSRRDDAFGCTLYVRLVEDPVVEGTGFSPLHIIQGAVLLLAFACGVAPPRGSANVPAAGPPQRRASHLPQRLAATSSAATRSQSLSRYVSPRAGHLQTSIAMLTESSAQHCRPSRWQRRQRPAWPCRPSSALAV